MPPTPKTHAEAPKTRTTFIEGWWLLAGVGLLRLSNHFLLPVFASVTVEVALVSRLGEAGVLRAGVRREGVTMLGWQRC